MHQPPLITRKTVNGATWSLLTSMALALALIACGPTNGGPTPTGDVTITVTIVGDGRVTFDAADFTCSSGTCTLALDEGTDVSLAAIPNAGRVLVEWDGPCSPFANTCAWEADERVGVTVTFAPHALRFDLQGDGEGSFAIDVAGEVTECREACGVALQQPLAVTIIYFDEGSSRTTLGPWTGTCAYETATYCLVNVDGVTTIGMTWRHPPIAANPRYTTMQGTLLTVAAPGVLADVVDTPGDTHTASLVTPPANGTIVDLADDGSFTYEPNASFSGDDEFTFRVTDAFGNTGDGIATVTVSLLPTLTVATSGDGGGNVISSPAGINLDDEDTSTTFAQGTPIVLTATPDADSDFEGWTGVTCDPGTDDDECAFTITTTTTVTAAFAPIIHTLTVATSGDGGGNVISSPAGINLDDEDTSTTFAQGTPIVLTATPDADSDFEGWTGVTCDPGTDDDECAFTITTTTTVTAQFTPGAATTITPSTTTLTVTTSGDGTGNVTSTPTGIDLDANARSATFTRGTEIELTAHPDSDSDLDEWSGVICDEGDDEDTCTFILIQDTTVDAEFDD